MNGFSCHSELLSKDIGRPSPSTLWRWFFRKLDHEQSIRQATNLTPNVISKSLTLGTKHDGHFMSKRGMCHSAKPQRINLNKHWSLGKVVPTQSATCKGLIIVHYTEGRVSSTFALLKKKNQNSQNLLEKKNKNIGLPYPLTYFFLALLWVLIDLD